MAKAYLDVGGERELLIEDVASVDCKDSRVRIANLFGETRELEAVIREIDFQNGSIVLERPG
ncbi:MAG: CooT family nickel-binding protein [Deltaproteobacteria bacterium]|nr:CooT family nickel-binding protein [Deltaproteobacteria bacterium]MBW2419213.1 CooT family nickel-binding protein [Deltaproteobacteria bacterium]